MSTVHVVEGGLDDTDWTVWAVCKSAETANKITADLLEKGKIGAAYVREWEIEE